MALLTASVAVASSQRGVQDTFFEALNKQDPDLVPRELESETIVKLLL